jgi:hypothetical protein
MCVGSWEDIKLGNYPPVRYGTNLLWVKKVNVQEGGRMKDAKDAKCQELSCHEKDEKIYYE